MTVRPETPTARPISARGNSSSGRSTIHAMMAPPCTRKMSSSLRHVPLRGLYEGLW